MKLKDNQKAASFTLDASIYPLESILNTCYAFIDRLYFFLDKDSKENIIVLMKGKKRLSEKQLNLLKDEFFNKLLHYALRHKIGKNNKRIREYIIGRALFSALPSFGLDSAIDNKQPDYLKDPLGIAVPWEEKYGKKNDNSDNKS